MSDKDEIEIRRNAGRLINQALNGEITPDDAITRFAEFGSTQEKSISKALHALYHYRDDKDIRRKDKAYAELQIRGLKDMANRLIEGLPFADDQSYW